MMDELAKTITTKPSPKLTTSINFSFFFYFFIFFFFSFFGFFDSSSSKLGFASSCKVVVL
jgi:hypothetical protein